jgi:transposase
VHGAFTEQYSAFWLGGRSLESMADAGILPGFAGIVVSDRYQNYFHPRWEHIAGNQACLSHLLRDYEDCAESYPGAVWPVQAPRALRGLIHAWHVAREQGLDAILAGVRDPLEREFRHAVPAGLASVPRVPGPKNSTKQKPGRELLEFCRDRRSDVLLFAEDTSIWPTNNISERGVRPLKTQQKISGQEQAMVSHWYFYGFDADFGPFYVKCCRCSRPSSPPPWRWTGPCAGGSFSSS